VEVEMKRLFGFRIYQEDALVIRWSNSSNAAGWENIKTYYQGKRIPWEQYKRFPWVREMIRVYVEQGTTAAIVFIKRQNPKLRIKEAVNLLDSFRNPDGNWK
jgi:hypothetical protein